MTTVDLHHFTVRSVRGGWTSTCRECSRQRTHKSVAAASTWQDAHVCATAAIASTVRAAATEILASLTPDTWAKVLERRADLAEADRAHLDRRTRLAMERAA